MTSTPRISLALRGPLDGVLTLGGPIDADTVARTRELLSVVVGTGARHVIVDLTDAREVPAGLLSLLSATSWELARRDGWLLVEGAADVGPRSSLLEAFRAYRTAVVAA